MTYSGIRGVTGALAGARTHPTTAAGEETNKPVLGHKTNLLETNKPVLGHKTNLLETNKPVLGHKTNLLETNKPVLGHKRTC